MPVARHLSLFFATGGYLGFLPGAPGTAGSIAGLALFWILAKWPLTLQAVAVTSLFLLGVLTSGVAEHRLGTKDPGAIVIDEIVGMVVALLTLPHRAGYVVAAFCLFRFLDIWKPMSALERLPGGWGIMCDDLAAALITNLLLQAVHFMLVR
jgi:phosphatidylglycerophosphatase A